MAIQIYANDAPVPCPLKGNGKKDSPYNDAFRALKPGGSFFDESNDLDKLEKSLKYRAQKMRKALNATFRVAQTQLNGRDVVGVWRE